MYACLLAIRDCPANIPPQTKVTKFTENGLEIFSNFTARLGNRQDEDCLALNTWTKLLPTREAQDINKPVFVFFHGGQFTIPGPHSPSYNGQYLADNEDVVVVTVDHRLRIFGSPGARVTEQNAGRLD